MLTRRELLGVLAALPMLSSANAQTAWQEGRDFLRLAAPQPIEPGSGIEVLEFFSYGCPHCNDLEEFLGPWLRQLPADVSFRRVPVLFHPPWVNLAKLHFTLEAIGRADLAGKVFHAVHARGVKLYDEKVFIEWGAGNGLDAAKVREAWNSFAVSGKMNRARTLAQAFRVDGVPTLFVDGKFKLQPTTEGMGPVAHRQAPSLLDFLIAKARAERNKK